MERGQDVPQHLVALASANQVRLKRAELRRQVRCGEVELSMLIWQVPREMESLMVGEMLMWQHRWGWTRMRRLLSALLISEAKTLGSCTERQRKALIRALGGVEEPVQQQAA